MGRGEKYLGACIAQLLLGDPQGMTLAICTINNLLAYNRCAPPAPSPAPMFIACHICALKEFLLLSTHHQQ